MTDLSKKKKGATTDELDDSILQVSQFLIFLYYVNMLLDVLIVFIERKHYSLSE